MDQLIASFASDKEEVASEIEVMQSIYGDTAIRPWHGEGSAESSQSANNIAFNSFARYTISLNLPSHEEISFEILVSLPSSYPESLPPQLQLLSRYIGPYGADSELFGEILRTYISVNGVEFIPRNVCVFDGIQNVLERCNTWYEEKLSADLAGELQREDVRDEETSERPSKHSNPTATLAPARIVELPENIEIFEGESILDRKSVFVGRACHITDPSQVPLVLDYLLSDRKIARANHPIIHAWRCQVGNILHQDNDDDRETAAGGRLAHLLQIMGLTNVLVVVTRYFGGIHLGPDRFKHINQAARNALDVGGFLDAPEDSKRHTGRGKKH